MEGSILEKKYVPSLHTNIYIQVIKDIQVWALTTVFELIQEQQNIFLL